MYTNKFVVSLRQKHSNRFYKEENDKVLMPFDSSYDIYMKNMNSDTARVEVYIQDTKITRVPIEIKGNQSYVLNATDDNKQLWFVASGSTGGQYTIDTPIDGMIRVEVTYLKDVKPIPYTPSHEWHIRPYYDYYNNYNNYSLNPSYSDQYKFTVGDGDCNNVTTGQVNYTVDTQRRISVNNISCVDSKAGKTVFAGEEQQNKSSSSGWSVLKQEDEKFTMVLRISGYIENTIKPVPADLHSRSKIFCSSCGKKHDSTDNFCSSCGNRLKH